MKRASLRRKTFALAAAGAAVVLALTVSVPAVANDTGAAYAAAVDDSPEVTITPRTLGSNAYVSVSVSVRNRADVPVSIKVEAPFGSKSFSNVAPGATVSVSLNTRTMPLPAGTVSVTATGQRDGAAFTRTVTADYPSYDGVCVGVTTSIEPFCEPAVDDSPEVTITPRTLGSSAYVSVSVRNRADVPVSIKVEALFGSKSFSNVAPGATVSVSLNTRTMPLPAGDLTVTATGQRNGAAFTRTVTADYSP